MDNGSIKQEKKDDYIKRDISYKMSKGTEGISIVSKIPEGK